MEHERTVERDPDAVHGEGFIYGRGYARNTIRAIFTLIGAAAAGFLIWLASLFELEQTGEFWAVVGLVAAAGFVLILSQLLGGWTKWGLPKVSSAVLLLGWLPTAVAGLWILLTIQPDGGWQQSRLESWSENLGILGFVTDFAPFAAALALALGVVTGFILDTAGPRLRRPADEAVVPEEDVHDYERREVVTTPTDETRTEEARTDEPVHAGERRVEIHDPDRRERV